MSTSRTIGIVFSIKDKCSSVVSKISHSFRDNEREAIKLGKDLKSLSLRFSALAGAGIATFVGLKNVITSNISKVNEYGDRIDKMSKRVGLSTKEYQKWDFIMSQNGGSVDNLQGGIKSLTKHIGNVQGGVKDSIAIFKKLGVSVYNTNGTLRSQESVFNDCVRAIQNLKNPTEKAVIGQKLFNRGFQEMAPLLNQTSESVNKLRQDYEQLGLGISDENIKSAVQLTDTMDKLNRAFEVVGLQLGIALTPAIQEFCNSLISAIPQIKEVMIPTLKILGKTLGWLVKNFDVVVPVVVSLTVALNGLRLGALLCNTTMIAFMTSNPFGWVLGAIALITTLTVAIVKLVKHYKKLNDAKKKANEEKEPQLKDVPAVMTAKKHALGTSYSSGGVALVGEYGPELVNLPRGSNVTPANKTNSVLNNNSSDITINLNIAGNVIGNREYMKELMQYMALEFRKVIPA